MSQQVQELIDKIKSEGVDAAQQEANKITQEAKRKADELLAQAKQKADRMLSDADLEIKRSKESTEVSLKRASRDMILSLRTRIQETLQKIIHEEVSESLTSEHLAKILENILEKSLHQKEETASVEVTLNAKDLEYLKKNLIAKLQKKIKERIHFKTSDEIGAGFTISFDSGKSCFDFTDESLAEYLGQFLNAQVAALVKEA